MWFFTRRSSVQLYKVRATYHDENNFPTCWINNIDNINIQWAAGKPIEFPIPKTIHYSVDKKLPLDDYVMTSGGCVLVSNPLCDLFCSMSSCIMPYESTVLFDNITVCSDCRTLNFEASFPCLDLKRSRFSGGGYSSGKFNGFLEKMVIAEDRIPPNENAFRLGESPVHILATELFVEKVAERGFTGFEFIDVVVVRS